MAGIMSKLKSGVTSAANEKNPILEYFDIGKEHCNAGPSLIWRVFNAVRKSDKKECAVFIMDKRIVDKLYRAKRKESMLERLRYSITTLEKINSPKMLHIIHPLEEGHYTMAFASEPIIGSLHNILAWHESNMVPGGPPPVMPRPISLGPPAAQAQQLLAPTPRQAFAKEYHFLDIELRWGILQIVEALGTLHYTYHLAHRNVCPQVIVVTKRGSWKLFGIEYSEPVDDTNPVNYFPAPPWSMKIAKLAQPNLDFIAPEMQSSGHAGILSDMFSLGLVICAVFNNGKSLIQACNNPILYMKQIDNLDQQLNMMMDRIPQALQEAVQRLLNKDSHLRPTSLLLPLIKYFKGPNESIISVLQFLDSNTIKDAKTKQTFYHGQLMETLPFIPKKLRWQTVWYHINLELRSMEMIVHALPSVIWLANESTPEEFEAYIMPSLQEMLLNSRTLINSTKGYPAYVLILENLHIFVKKCPKDSTHEVMSTLYRALDKNTPQNQSEIQVASLIAMQNVSDYIEDKLLYGMVLCKVKFLLEKNQSDVKVISLVLGFYEKILGRLERNHILEQVIPTLLAMRLSDPDIINRVVRLYKSMLTERKFGLTSNVMATKMIPSLAPQTVNPALNVDQFTNLMQILYEMLDNIEQHQSTKLKMDGQSMSSPERRALRHQISTDNMNAPPFNIPNLRVERRKTSSAEDMARKNSITGPPPTGSVGGLKGSGIGSWWFNSSNNNDNNFLRVITAFPTRRLSDNTLMTPKIRIAPSCASSPGGTPGGTSGLPTRRHSSIGPQERRSSAVNLSPPTGYQYRGRAGGSGSSLSVPSTSQCVGGSMPNTSSSVPFLLTSSMQSIRSRRPSAASSHGSQGIVQQLSSGLYQLLSGRKE